MIARCCTPLAVPALLALVLAAPAGSQEADANAADRALFERLDANSDGKLTPGEIPGDKLRFFERMLKLGDKNGDGILTREEFLEALRASRLGFEASDDGAADGEPPAEEPNEPPRRPLSGPNLGPLFNLWDRNGDGKLTLDELPEALHPRFEPLFERLGKDELTRDEFLRFASGDGPAGNEPAGNEPAGDEPAGDEPAGGEKPDDARPNEPEPNVKKPSADEAARFFRRLDADGDGRLTLEETPEAARSRIQTLFRRAGKAEDGWLSLDEFLELTGHAARQPTRTEQPQPRDAHPHDANDEPRPEPPHRRQPPGPRNAQRPPAGGESRGPRFFRLLDADGDGVISREELAQAVELFDELDANGDGAIDLREFFGLPPAAEGLTDGNGPRPRPAPRSDGPAPRDAEMADRILKEADRNGDGKISPDEAPERLRENFSRFDLNGDGLIDREELIQGFERSRR